MFAQTQIAANSFVQLLPYITALALVAGGVRLFIDRENEDSYIETSPVFSKAMLTSILAHVEAMHLEPIPEFECPAMLLPNGGTRIYLAERVMQLDGHVHQAV